MKGWRGWSPTILYVFLLIDSKAYDLINYLSLDLVRKEVISQEDALKIGQIHYLTSMTTIFYAMLSVSLVWMLRNAAKVESVILWNTIGSLAILAVAFPIIPFLDGDTSKSYLNRSRYDFLYNTICMKKDIFLIFYYVSSAEMFKIASNHLYGVGCVCLLSKNYRNIAWIMMVCKIVVYTAQLHLTPFLGLANTKNVTAVGESCTNILMTLVTGTISTVKTSSTKLKSSPLSGIVLLSKLQDNANSVGRSIGYKLKNTCKTLSSVFFLSSTKLADEAIFVLLYAPLMNNEEFLSTTLWATICWPAEVMSLNIIIWVASKTQKLQSKDMKSAQNLIMMVQISFMILLPFTRSIISVSSTEKIDEVMEKFMNAIPSKMFFSSKIVLESILTAEGHYGAIFLSSSLALAIEMGTFYSLKSDSLMVESIPNFTYFLKHLFESIIMLSALVWILHRRNKNVGGNNDEINTTEEGRADGGDVAISDGAVVFEMAKKRVNHSIAVNVDSLEDDNRHHNRVNDGTIEDETDEDYAINNASKAAKNHANNATKVQMHAIPKQASPAPACNDDSFNSGKGGQEGASVGEGGITCGDLSSEYNHDSGASTAHSEDYANVGDDLNQDIGEDDRVCGEVNEELDDGRKFIQDIDETDNGNVEDDLNQDSGEGERACVEVNEEVDGERSFIQDMEEVHDALNQDSVEGDRVCGEDNEDGDGGRSVIQDMDETDGVNQEFAPFVNMYVLHRGPPTDNEAREMSDESTIEDTTTTNSNAL